jgi:hypothetical protein
MRGNELYMSLVGPAGPLVPAHGSCRVKDFVSGLGQSSTSLTSCSGWSEVRARQRHVGPMGVCGWGWGAKNS